MIGRTGDMVMEAKVLLVADYWLYIHTVRLDQGRQMLESI
jgi:hypothetical protein